MFFQGDSAKELFLIKGGRVRLSKIIEDGSELTLDYRKAGDFVGENMLTEDLIYPFSAWCIEDTITCGYSNNQFQELILKHPKRGLKIIKNMGERTCTHGINKFKLKKIVDKIDFVAIATEMI